MLQVARFRFRGIVSPLSFAGLVFFPFFVFLPSASFAQQLQQDFHAFELDRGASLYESNCAECHTDGTGVPGVNFRTGQFHRAKTDEDLLVTIRSGVPGTVMPPHADLSGQDDAALVAYIRSLANKDSVSVKAGDPEKGKALFETKGECLSCHRVGTKGSRTALNLSDTGTLHPASFLQRALIDPNSVLAEMPESRLVRAVTNNGKVIDGRRLNEDTYTIQLMDDHENLMSLDKDSLRSLTVVKESPMPSVRGKLSDAEIGDLVAYLVSLKSSSAVAPVQFGITGGVGAAFGGRGRGRGPTTPAPANQAPVGGATGPRTAPAPGGNP